MIEARHIVVRGVVQGVGFRPFVYRLAKHYLINGWVLNSSEGVHIHAEGEAQLIDEFVFEIANDAPAASRVDEIELEDVPLEDFGSFEIRFSDEQEVDRTTLISPDLATCEDCVRELFDPANRRYRYPFINCTNCGPRFTIIERLPYDREHTSMKNFPMCEDCAREYVDPADRRFHAQPDACFDCGPQVSWFWAQPQEQVAEVERRSLWRQEAEEEREAPQEQILVEQKARWQQLQTQYIEGLVHDADGVAWARTREESDRVFAAAVALLRAGGILTVKGLGGFHLACDATNEEAVATLRKRKRRKGKAFAIMVPDLATARSICEISEAEERLLTSPQRPIVLLRKRADAQLARGVADGLSEFGVMLPSTPVQHLLLHDFAGMLVMTSGNVHDEPIVTDDAAARQVLAGIADVFLGNNRAVRSRYDDSVLRVLNLGASGDLVQVVRRARGYAPMPLALSFAADGAKADGAQEDGAQASEQQAASVPDAASGTAKQLAALFATGPEQKNTFCLVRGDEAFVSQHIGDMENAETFDAWLEAKKTYEGLFEVMPRHIVCDLHPEYLTTKWAREQEQQGARLTAVQHHHAHIVSAMAENNLTGPVAGIAFDGTGFGTDGNIWGGELLLCNLSAFERFGNFSYVPMPGGAAAIKYPLRMAYGALWAFDLLDHPGAADALARLGDTAELCGQMIERGLNTPFTSSVGRLFDAASALLGICDEPRYEGEAAVLLEAAIGGAFDGEEDCAAADAANAMITVDPTPEQTADRYEIALIKNVATPESTAQDTSVLLFDAAPTFRALLDDYQAGFLRSLIARRFHDAFVQLIVRSAECVCAMYDIKTVVLSGGVFANRYLSEHAIPALAERGFTVAVNRELPPNDGCISFGQAVIGLHS